MHEWIANWLRGRQHRVVINGIASEWTPATRGVPQNLLSGWVLFIIYINDVDVGANNLIGKFAAGTTVVGKA